MRGWLVKLKAVLILLRVISMMLSGTSLHPAVPKDSKIGVKTGSFSSMTLKRMSLRVDPTPL